MPYLTAVRHGFLQENIFLSVGINIQLIFSVRITVKFGYFKYCSWICMWTTTTPLVNSQVAKLTKLLNLKLYSVLSVVILNID